MKEYINEHKQTHVHRCVGKRVVEGVGKSMALQSAALDSNFDPAKAG